MALPNVQTHLSALFCATQDFSANFLNLLLENSLVALRLSSHSGRRDGGRSAWGNLPVESGSKRQLWQVNCSVFRNRRQLSLPRHGPLES